VWFAPRLGRGNSSNNGEDSNNRNPAGVPVGGDPAIFNNGGNGNTSINRLYFNPGAAAYTIGSRGQTLTLGTEYQGNSEIILDAGLANNQTILANLLYKESSSPVSGITITNYSSADLDIAGDTLLFNRGHYPSGKLALFETFDDPFVVSEFSRRRRVFVPLLQRETWLPTPEDVVVQKLRWGRNKDLDDARDVLAVQGPETLDMAYIEHWCGLHGTLPRLKEALDGIPPLE